MSDRELIKHIQNGSREYLDILLENHLQAIFNACFRVCLDEQVANDIAQEVIIKIIKNIDSFQNKSEFSTWYYRIAYNESIGYLKKQKWTIDIAEFENILTLEENSFYNSDQSQLSWDVTQAINSLPLIDRNIVLYFYYDELKISQIADILSMNENTIKTKLKRAKEFLKPQLQIYEDINKKL